MNYELYFRENDITLDFANTSKLNQNQNQLIFRHIKSKLKSINNKIIIKESRATMYQLKWLKQNSEKAEINDGGDTLKLTSRAKSDFWITPTRRVLDGSFGYEEITGDFVAQVHFIGEYHSQYDQAGLMIYLNDDHWLKAGIEMINDRQYV
ncbi:hypothetical protein K502DRAFT_325104, partial [Neoconidiobolus thromboides FSU 785]